MYLRIPRCLELTVRLRASTLDGAQIIRWALELEFSPHILADLAAFRGPDAVDTLFVDIMTLVRNLDMGQRTLLRNTLVTSCGIPNIAKQLLKRIGQLRRWGPPGFAAILRILNVLQSTKDVFLEFIDGKVYNRLIVGYWKLVRQGEGVHGFSSRDLGALLSYAVATIGE